MFINVVQCILLLFFIMSSIYVLVQDKDNLYGVIVNAGNKKLTSGKQGLQTTFGRLKENDVVNESSVVSRKHICFNYDGINVIPDDCYRDKCSSGVDYSLASTGYDFSKAGRLFKIDMKYLPVVISIFFTITRYFSIKQDFDTPILLIPFTVLVIYQVVNVFLVVNTAPIIECSFSVFLSFYIYSMLYKSTSDTLDSAVKKCCLGVITYVFVALIVKLILMFIPLSKKTKIKPLKNKFSNKSFVTVNDVLLFVATLGIVFFIAFNLAFAKEINGARNWVYIGSLSIQPSEIVKVLLIFVVVIPINKRFDDFSNVFYLLVIPAICFLYCLIIKDVGALIQMAAIWVLAIILQSSNIFVTGLVLSGMWFGVKLVLRVSSTAAQRYKGWISSNIWDALASKGIFENEFGIGYQPIKSLTAAVANGGAFGSNYYDIDIMKNVEASNSDLVMSIICQHYGYITMFLLLIILILIFISVILLLKKQTKVQQTLSLLSVFLVLVATILNVGGTFGIIPLTGVVLPYFSYGISSAVSYGAVMGMMTGFSKDAYSIINNNKLSEKDKTFVDSMKILYKKINKSKIGGTKNDSKH